MKLVPKPARVLKHSSALRLIEISIGIGILQFVADISPALKDFLPFDPIWFTMGASIFGAAAWGARFVAQSKMRVEADGE